MNRKKKILITGGCGFIGAAATERFSSAGHHVIALDNLSRPASRLRASAIGKLANVTLNISDIRDMPSLSRLISHFEPDLIIHCAAQVAVTTSLSNPMEDFAVNVLGTVNLLEGIRNYSPKCLFINISSNKVYGELADVQLDRNTLRYCSRDGSLGFSEALPVDPQTPYGTSKYAAESYCREYSESYGLSTITLRQSCIYGPSQNGTVDQGWVSHLVSKALTKGVVEVFGDGMQVRDLLHVGDLVDLYANIIDGSVGGGHRFFNVGGGIGNTISLLEVCQYISKKKNKSLEISYFPWRSRDQKFFASDNAAVSLTFGWLPKTNVLSGLDELIEEDDHQ